jgi:hypothetical protein
MFRTVLNEPVYDSDAVNKKYVDKLMKNVKENTVYSDKEQQIGTWFDKPLYRKTYQGAFNGKNDLYIAHGLSNYKAVNVYGVSISNTTNNTIPLNVVRPLSASYEMGFYVTSTDIVVETSKTVDRTGTIVYVTLEYIKTN